ncbi:MAG: hypothetical protein AAGI92_06460 [Pseudomonadota bacterium]
MTPIKMNNTWSVRAELGSKRRQIFDVSPENFVAINAATAGCVCAGAAIVPTFFSNGVVINTALIAVGIGFLAFVVLIRSIAKLYGHEVIGSRVVLAAMFILVGVTLPTNLWPAVVLLLLSGLGLTAEVMRSNIPVSATATVDRNEHDADNDHAVKINAFGELEDKLSLGGRILEAGDRLQQIIHPEDRVAFLNGIATVEDRGQSKCLDLRLQDFRGAAHIYTVSISKRSGQIFIGGLQAPATALVEAPPIVIDFKKSAKTSAMARSTELSMAAFQRPEAIKDEGRKQA